MRRFALPLALLAAVLVALAAAWFTLAGKGGGGERVTTEAPPVGPFTRVGLNGYAELVLVQGDRESVTIESSPRATARIRVRSADGRLSIDAVEDRPWWSFLAHGTPRPPRITVHFRNLESLDVAGAVKVAAASIETRAARHRGVGRDLGEGRCAAGAVAALLRFRRGEGGVRRCARRPVDRHRRRRRLPRSGARIADRDGLR